MKKLILFTLLAGLSSVSMAFDIQGEGEIYRVVDGDTFIMTDISEPVYKKLKQQADKHKYFNDHYRSVRFRLGNTDTAESKHKDESKNTKAGERAARYVKQLIEKDSFQFRCWDIGDYYRAICSVYNNDFDLGAHLIKEGYSDYVTYWGKHPFWHERYQKAADR